MMRAVANEDERAEMLAELLESTGWTYVIDAARDFVGPIRKSVFGHAGRGKADSEIAMEARDVQAVGRFLDAVYKRAGHKDGLPTKVRGVFE